MCNNSKPCTYIWQALFDNLQQRKKEVRKLYEKRKSSFKKVTTRHGDRPVQLVEPSKKSVKDAALSTANRSKTTKPPEKTSKRNSVVRLKTIFYFFLFLKKYAVE